MKIKAKQYAISLYEATKNLPSEKIKTALDNFINILIRNNALKMAPQIINDFISYANKKEGVVDLKIKTAYPINDEIVREICQIAPKFLERKVSKINVKKEIDKTLLGGFCIKSEDVIFDVSLKNKLKILKNNLLIK